MARLPRLCPPGIPVHIIQRGINRQNCFACNWDYLSYMGYLADASVAYSVDIHAWVLMGNHVHILATSRIEGGVSRMMQYIGRYYVRFYNHRYSRTGSLWEGRFKSCVVDNETYFLTCQRYVELNPVRACIVDDPAGYQWSSYRYNALDQENELVSPSDIYLSLGPTKIAQKKAYRALFEVTLDNSMIKELRDATKKCLAFGGEDFKLQIESQYKRRVNPKKPGPKKE